MESWRAPFEDIYADINLDDYVHLKNFTVLQEKYKHYCMIRYETESEAIEFVVCISAMRAHVEAGRLVTTPDIRQQAITQFDTQEIAAMDWIVKERDRQETKAKAA